MASRSKELEDDLLRKIDKGQVGFNSCLQGPYGTKRIVYTDYTASGRALEFIEDYIRSEVLPSYGNTHTTTTFTSRQSTHFREEARLIIRNAVNASESDCVFFTGSGCTGAVHNLIHNLNPSRENPPVVFVSPFEHHSNLLPWRETGAEVVWIAQDAVGNADIHDLEDKLKNYSKSGRQLIGALNAASNITGVLTDTDAFTILLHRYGALAFWDYATAAPYIKMDMNPVRVIEGKELVYKDAIYFSPHKFVGGVESPGVLVAKKALFQSSLAPHACGGGTVFFVTSSTHRYFKEAEMKEEGGTPSIVGAIRAGLAVQLKEAVGSETILSLEEDLCRYVFSQWEQVEELVIVGPGPHTSRLPVFSFLVRHPPSGKFLHHNYVCALLNDLFGIQARGGCSCAGPYAQDLLGLSEEMAKRYEALVMEDSRLDREHLRRYHEYSEREVFRPGITRLSFPYFMRKEAVNYVVQAVTMVAKHGWKLQCDYTLNPETGLFKHHRNNSSKERKWLSAISFLKDEVTFSKTASSSTSPSYQEMLSCAEGVFSSVSSTSPPTPRGDAIFTSEEEEVLCWFFLPSDVAAPKDRLTTPPFEPRHYPRPFSALDLPDALQRAKDDAGRSLDEIQSEFLKEEEVVHKVCFHSPPKAIFRPTMEAITEYNMIHDGDRVLVCVSGGKDSLSLLHTLHQYQFLAKSKGVVFELGAVTVDPKSSSYNPRPLISYMAALEVPYFYEEQGILQQASSLPECDSICSFCSRMKRGCLYSCARREGYNVLAMGQHLDDLAESFMMAVFHNGFLRTMKANYTVQEGDLRVIRPFVFLREKELRKFARDAHLPVIAENCPACFEAPKERHRMKQLLAAQELLFPRLFPSILAAIKPLMARDRTGMESKQLNS